MDSNRNAAQGGAGTGPSSGVGPDLNTNLDWRWQLQPDARQRMVNKIMDTLTRHLPEGLGNELQNIAVRFEEKIYSVATSESDYLRKISLKMLAMENKMQPGLNPFLPNENLMGPGEGMTSQQPSLNPGQSLGMPQVMNQPPASRQQLPILQGLQHNMPTAAPGGPSGATITPMSGPSISNSNPMSGPSGPTGSLPMDMYSNTQRRKLPQQHMLQNQMLYHQQQLKMLHKLQQQQQSLLQMSSALAGGSKMMSAAPTGGMLQSQLNSIQQQPVGQGGLFQQQSLMQQQPQPTMQNPTVSMQLTNNVTDLQQKQLQMQPYQMQQRQLQPNQMQQNQMLNQQMMVGQQKNKLLESGGTSNMYNTQRQMQMQRQARMLQQQLPKQQHLPSQLQSQQQQLPQQQQPSMMQQRKMQMPQQQMQGSPDLLHMQNNNAIDPQTQQQQQFIPQQQRVLQDVASSPASIDSTAQTGHPGDWQEETYQRLKYLKDAYFADLREIHQKLSIKLSQLDSIVPPNARGGEQIEKMKHFKMVLERMMATLQLGKHKMQIGLKDKLSLYEKQILSIVQNHKKAPQQQPQAGAPSDQPHFPGLQQSQPGLQSQQLSQQQQPQQMDSQNQLQQQLNTSAMPQSNNIGMPNAMQQGIQNTLQSDQLQASSTGLGSLQQGTMDSSMQNTMKMKKWKICEDCMRKRNNPN